MKYTALVTCDFAPSWLALPRAERKTFRAEHVLPVLARHRGRVKARFFDSESFHAEFSDFILFETERIEDYFLLVEELRDNPLVTQGHVQLLEAFLTIENGYEYFALAVLGREPHHRTKENR
jgi:hypothetical protein